MPPFSTSRQARCSCATRSSPPRLSLPPFSPPNRNTLGRCSTTPGMILWNSCVTPPRRAARDGSASPSSQTFLCPAPWSSSRSKPTTRPPPSPSRARAQSHPCQNWDGPASSPSHGATPRAPLSTVSRRAGNRPSRQSYRSSCLAPPPTPRDGCHNCSSGTLSASSRHTSTRPSTSGPRRSTTPSPFSPTAKTRCDSATKTSSSCATHSKAFPPTSRSTPRRSDPCKARTVGWDCARTSPCES
mmetsp:Transcript_18899/g.61803  ORF Transcript_18899/g.61803 Transcript_18899/m.61803 type:complete len:243 (-) Transcript_18899:382-1110(-)